MRCCSKVGTKVSMVGENDDMAMETRVLKQTIYEVGPRHMEMTISHPGAKNPNTTWPRKEWEEKQRIKRENMCVGANSAESSEATRRRRRCAECKRGDKIQKDCCPVKIFRTTQNGHLLRHEKSNEANDGAHNTRQ